MKLFVVTLFWLLVSGADKFPFGVFQEWGVEDEESATSRWGKRASSSPCVIVLPSLNAGCLEIPSASEGLKLHAGRGCLLKQVSLC